MCNFKLDQLLMMEAHPCNENYNVRHHKHHRRDTPPSQLQYGRKGSKKYTTREALEAIVADEDIGDENFDCGSVVEYVPDSENESESGESDLDDSLALPSTSYSLNKEKVSETLAGNVYHFYK